MVRSGVLFLAFCAALSWGGPAQGRVTAATAKPKRVTISAEKPSVVSITWYAKGKHTPEDLVRVTMDEGQFFLGDRKGVFLDFAGEEMTKEFRTGEDGTYLIAFKDRVTLPRAIVEQAAAENKSIYYERRFTDHTLDVPVLAHVIFQPVRSVGDTLAVTGLRLNFPDKKGWCHIGTGESLKAEALVEVEGSGMLKGRWEIRKRPFLNEYRTLRLVHYPVKEEIVLGVVSPELPSEVSGPVDVRLVITEPKPAGPPPFVSCLVLGTEDTALEATEEPGAALPVLSPSGPQPVDAHMRIKWSADQDYRFFRIVFLRVDGGVMAAMDAPRGVREIEVPPEIIAQLEPKTAYQVKVSGHR